MKTTRFITALGLLMLALTACNNEDEIPGGGKLPEGAVHLTAQIEGVQTRAPQLDTEGKGNFAQGDVWGMYAYTDVATAGENMEYKYRETVLYWKDLSETSPVTFSAHYPRITTTINNPAEYMYIPYARNHTDDLLHATATASKGGTVVLTFKHLMHRLIINLTAGEGMTGTDLSSALISSAGKDSDPTMYAGVEVNLLTGEVNYGRYEGLNTNVSSGNAEWKVAPQDLTAGAEWLRIIVGEDTWCYNVPANLNSSNPDHPTRLESGKQLTLNLTLKKNQQTGQTEVELSGSDISGWGDGGTITDDVMIGGDTPAGVTTAEALLAALKTGGTSDNPTKVTLGADITMPKVPDNSSWMGVPMTGGGYYKIDGGGHTLSWVIGSKYYLGNNQADDDATYIEITNTKLVYDGENMATVCIYNGKITLGEGVTADGHTCMILASGVTTTLELGDGCVLSSSDEHVVSVVKGATLVLNGGTIAAGAYIELGNEGPIPPVVSIPKALTNDVPLILRFYMNTAEILIAEGASGHQLTQADFNHLKPHPTESTILPDWADNWLEFEGNFELYLDAGNNQIKLKKKAAL